METCYKLEKVYGREFFMRAMAAASMASSDAGVLA